MPEDCAVGPSSEGAVPGYELAVFLIFTSLYQPTKNLISLYKVKTLAVTT